MRNFNDTQCRDQEHKPPSHALHVTVEDKKSAGLGLGTIKATTLIESGGRVKFQRKGKDDPPVS